jgi:hypothetical protein
MQILASAPIASWVMTTQIVPIVRI